MMIVTLRTQLVGIPPAPSMHTQTCRIGLPTAILSHHDAAATCRKKNLRSLVTRIIRLNYVNQYTASRPHFIHDRAVIPNLFSLAYPLAAYFRKLYPLY